MSVSCLNHKTSRPLVSVVIPAFNRAHSVARSIESVLEQTYRPLELIVVDDGSTDGIVDHLSPYSDRILLVSQPNSGPSSARNTGVAHAKGEIIAFLDSDDTWEPTKLERQMTLMIRGGVRVPCCVCNSRNLIDGIPSKTSFENAGIDCTLSEGYWLNPDELIATRFLLFNQVVAVRRDAFEKVGGYKVHMRLLEDHDLAFRLSLLGPWAFISDTLVTKYDEADGLGVQARQNPIVHVQAWMTAIREFLNEPIERGGVVERQVRKSLWEGSVEIIAVRMCDRKGIAAAAIGRLLQYCLRVKRGVARRLPSWPRPKTVAFVSLGAHGRHPE
jgi:glycosyltransferase involved in cell wall biosynthesis